MGKKRRRTRAAPPNTIGQWLALRGIKQSALAEAVDVTSGYISELVSSRKTNASISVLLAIAKHLGCHVEELFAKPPNGKKST